MDAGDSVVAWTTENDAEDDNGDDVTGTGADEDETASGSAAPIDAERSPSISICWAQTNDILKLAATVLDLNRTVNIS